MQVAIVPRQQNQSVSARLCGARWLLNSASVQRVAPVSVQEAVATGQVYHQLALAALAEKVAPKNCAPSALLEGSYR